METSFLAGIGFGIGVTIGLTGLVALIAAAQAFHTWLFGDPPGKTEKAITAIHEKHFENARMQIEVLSQIARNLKRTHYHD